VSSGRLRSRSAFGYAQRLVTLTSSQAENVLRELVERRTETASREWFVRTSAAIGEAPDRGALLEGFTAATRRLGRARLVPSESEITRLAGAGVSWPIGTWGADELGRVALLVAAAAHWPEAEMEALVEECYRQGDAAERQAVLRALPLLPAPERFLDIAVDACRSHIQPLFEAIACENPYPGLHFPELNFNQMVLKALFTGVALARILGLEGRVTSELSRMAADYASERRAAGRSVPQDIGMVTEGRRTGERGDQP
jgi:hypothetical protein